MSIDTGNMSTQRAKQNRTTIDSDNKCPEIPAKFSKLVTFKSANPVS